MRRVRSVRRGILLGLALVAALVLLTACPAPGTNPPPGNGGPDPAGPEDVQEALDDTGAATEQLTGELASDCAITAMGEALAAMLGGISLDPDPGPLGFPGLGIALDPDGAMRDLTTLLVSPRRLPVGAQRILGPLSSHAELPRGEYTIDESGMLILVDDTASELIVGWTTAGGCGDAVLTIDWDADADTEVVYDDSGDAVEVPVDANVTLTVDGVTVVDLDLDASWFDGAPCTDPILEPTSIGLDGFIGPIGLDAVGFSISDTVGTDTITTSGAISIGNDGDSATFSWNLSADGTLSRDAGTCFLEDFVIASGSVSLAYSITVDGVTHSWSLAFDLEEVIYLDGFVSDVRLADGVLEVNGTEVATFSGTFADGDADADDYPGDQMTIVYADGSTGTLQDLLYPPDEMP